MMASRIIIGILGFPLDLDPLGQPKVQDGKKRTFKRLWLR